MLVGVPFFDMNFCRSRFLYISVAPIQSFTCCFKLLITFFDVKNISKKNAFGGVGNIIYNVQNEIVDLLKKLFQENCATNTGIVFCKNELLHLVYSKSNMGKYEVFCKFYYPLLFKST